MAKGDSATLLPKALGWYRNLSFMFHCHNLLCDFGQIVNHPWALKKLEVSVDELQVSSHSKGLSVLKIFIATRQRWLTSVILAAREAEIRRIAV
jgi:hypothetical protein